MTTQDLLNQFFTKAKSGCTVADDRKEYATMLSFKQRDFLVGLYKKETKDWDNPCKLFFTKLNEWNISIGDKNWKQSVKLTFTKF